MSLQTMMKQLQSYTSTVDSLDGSIPQCIDFLSTIDVSKPYIFYGVGTVANQLISFFDLQTSDFPNLIFCDKKGDTIDTFMGFPVITPDVLLQDHKETTIALTLLDYQEEVCAFLLQNGIQKENIAMPISEAFMDLLGTCQKLIPQKDRLSYFVLNILDHCNLNCQCCDHFACIAEKRFVTVADIEKDVIQMSKLLSGAVDRIGVMGGEPLLHPELLTILEKTRQSFPQTKIQVVTNGILLMSQPQAFWDCCKQYNIEIMNTKYPLKLRYDDMLARAKENGVTMDFYGGSGVVTKTSYKVPLDLLGKQNQSASFCHCFHANTLPLLMEGKFYACTVAPNVRHFNEKFGENLQLAEGDIFDIFSANSKEELFAFLSTPKPFCTHCMTVERVRELPWAVTKKVATEWLP